ncbi:MAG: hypothetical protein ACFFD4_36425 [Candidatus Odinarchaeota archaeon]
MGFKRTIKNIAIADIGLLMQQKQVELEARLAVKETALDFFAKKGCKEFRI